MHVWRVSDESPAPILATHKKRDPGPGEVGITIAACGLNFADLLMIKGTYQETPQRPFIPGLEVAGAVESIGPGVAGLSKGDRVAVYAGHGGLAEYGIFPASRAVLIPDAMPFDEAAGFQIAYGTSHLALQHRARLQPQETLLVLGAAGGVGLTAVEIGHRMGARVFACARGKDKLQAAAAAGASHLVEADEDELIAQVKALGGADVVYDPVGGTLAEAAARTVKPLGRIITIGFASGDIPKLKLNHLMVKNVDVLGFYWGGYLKFAPELLTASLGELLGWYEAGNLAPHISHRVPFERAPDGLELLRERKATGKVVVVMPGF